MQLDHLSAIVVDAHTGEQLDGPPHPMLYRECASGYPARARFFEGEWQLVSIDMDEWHRRHGHELRLVRVKGAPTAPIMTPARIAELEQDDADTLAELAVIRQRELS